MEKMCNCVPTNVTVLIAYVISNNVHYHTSMQKLYKVRTFILCNYCKTTSYT